MRPGGGGYAPLASGWAIHIGWPDYNPPEKSFTIVEFELLGKVFRARVTDGRRQGGFLVVYDCPEPVPERPDVSGPLRPWGSRWRSLACGAASTAPCSAGFDYQWYPTPECAHRPSLLARTIADLLAVLQERGEA
jgi:hypothetical protein